MHKPIFGRLRLQPPQTGLSVNGWLFDAVNTSKLKLMVPGMG